MNEPLIGRSMHRVDGRNKLTGDARYAGDVSLPGMVHLKVVRSDRPHANILALQTEQAKHYPGIVAVFTHLDIPGENRLRHGQQVLCDERVRCIGDPVALVAAETREAAQAAAELIRVDYEDLPGVFSPEEALLPDAVQLHDGGNVLLERTLLKGDPEQALRDAEVVITNTYRTQMVEHAYLEPEAGVAAYAEGRVTVWMPSKHAHGDRKEIAGLLGLPSRQVRIINATIGGSFGDKASLSPGYYAALVSLKTGRPAKLVYPREESFFASKKRHPFIIDYTTGATRDGRIRAVKVTITADAGAYAASTASVLLKALIHATGPYEIPNVLVTVRGVYTNNPVASAMRGLGVPQVAFAHESQMDILAEKVHKDPFTIRLHNCLQPGSLTATGQKLGSSVGLAETLKKVQDEIVRRGTPQPAGYRRYGWGIASLFYGIGSAGKDNPGTARIEADDAGVLRVYVGCGDVGQGSSTILTQIAAEALNVRPDRIRLIADDTDCCPDSGSTVASRITYLVGRAVQIAARKLQDLLQNTAASMMEVAVGDLSLEKGFFYSREDSGRTISIAQAAAKLRAQGISPEAEGVFGADVVALDPDTAQGSPMATYAFATQGALVSLDEESGQVEVLSLIAGHDVGRALNPANITGQLEGASAMGLGYGLMEEVLLEDGLIKNPSFSSYFLPTSLDVAETTSILVETAEPSGPFGAKGVGEPALIATAPAIINAISAVTGRRVTKLPLTADVLWKLLHPVHEQGNNSGS